MSDCCHAKKQSPSKQGVKEKTIDWLLWTSLSLISIAFVSYWFQQPSANWYFIVSSTAVEMLDAMWIGMTLGVVMVGWLNRVPREVVIATIGQGHTVSGLIRATIAGILLDLCNHGILMVGMKLYERGASLGQVMAFIIASPWNSFTLTFILIGLIGWQWTVTFIILSMLVAWFSGYIFDQLEKTSVLPQNPNAHIHEQNFSLISSVKVLFANADYSPSATIAMLLEGLKGSQMVFRWVLVGIVLVALTRAFIPAENFALWFGTTTSGLFLTLVMATIIEVCSEGSTPLAADLVTRANAPGNAFTFLMAGSATDYTEIMVIKDTTQSWKIALCLPLITVPQVLLIGWLINTNL